MMTPISVVLPSLSPMAGNDKSPVATLIPAATSPVTTPMAHSSSGEVVSSSALEGETPMDVDDEQITSFTTFKDSKKMIQVSRGGSANVWNSHQTQASMPSLGIFDVVEERRNSQMNGKRINNHSSPLSKQQSSKRKHDYQQDFTAIQVDATSSPYPHFTDITWSNCHPEPLAVSRWLRLTSNSKQYNFNIH